MVTEKIVFTRDISREWTIFLNWLSKNNLFSYSMEITMLFLVFIFACVWKYDKLNGKKQLFKSLEHLEVDLHLQSTSKMEIQIIFLVIDKTNIHYTYIAFEIHSLVFHK